MRTGRWSIVVAVASVGGLCALRAAQPATLVYADGRSEQVAIEGTGCSESICSRDAISGQTAGGQRERIPLDDVRSITGGHGNVAVIERRDRTQRRLMLNPNNRVLYLDTASGRAIRLDIGALQSVRVGEGR